MDLDGFEAWLRQQGYAERTVQDTVMSARGLAARVREGREIPRGMWYRARRLLEWAEVVQHELVLYPGLRVVAEPRPSASTGGRGPAMGSRRKARRKLAAQSFSDEGWRALAGGISRSDTREARVLEVMMVSGLRIGDALRIRRADLMGSFESEQLPVQVKGGEHRLLAVRGPLRAVLEKMAVAWGLEEHATRRTAPDVASWLVPGSEARLPIDSARKRVYRTLGRIGEDVGLTGRIHLHRMRRTIAVQALRLTGDVNTVGQLLGHAPGSTATAAYLDEARPDDVAKLQGLVHAHFLGDDE